MFLRRFVRTPRPTLARALYESAVRQSRAERLYAELNAPDTTEGRFELLTVHVVLLIDRLREAGEAVLSQGVFDCYVSDLDAALREMGVGDLSVGKRMRRLGQAFYGRAAAYRDAFRSGPDRAALEALIARTILGPCGADAGQLASYVLDCRSHLAGVDPAQAVGGLWPEG